MSTESYSTKLQQPTHKKRPPKFPGLAHQDSCSSFVRPMRKLTHQRPRKPEKTKQPAGAGRVRRKVRHRSKATAVRFVPHRILPHSLQSRFAQGVEHSLAISWIFPGNGTKKLQRKTGTDSEELFYLRPRFRPSPCHTVTTSQTAVGQQ